MLGFHSQNVPIGKRFEQNHVYVKNKGTDQYTDLGLLNGTSIQKAVMAYIPGYGYAQEKTQVEFRFVGKPLYVYNFFVQMSTSFSSTMPTYTCYNAGINQKNINYGDILNALTDKEGFCDFSIGVPSPSSYRTCKVQFTVIDSSSMKSIGDFYFGDESRWILYQAEDNTASIPIWKNPIPMWDDMLSTIPYVSLKIPQNSTVLYRIAPPVYYQYFDENIQGRVGTVDNPQNFMWRGGNDPDTYRQMDQGSILPIVYTYWSSSEGYKLEISKKGPGTPNFTLEIPGEHPIAYVTIVD